MGSTVAATHKAAGLIWMRHKVLLALSQVEVQGLQLVQKWQELAHYGWAEASQHVSQAAHLSSERGCCQLCNSSNTVIVLQCIAVSRGLTRVSGKQQHDTGASIQGNSIVTASLSG